MTATMAALGLNKVFILDKYFTELNKYWQNECLHNPEKPKPNNNHHYKYNHYHHHCYAGQSRHSNNKSMLGNVPNGDPSTPGNINDLIHLEAPITEDSLIRSIHSRFLCHEFFTNIGPVLISLNPYNELHNPLTPNSAHRQDDCYPLYRIVHEAVRQQTETGYPQAIILSGLSGSGKTYSSMIILRQLFNIIGGGPETDAFKHLAAAFTVLRSLGSAKTMENSESSRIGNFIEVQITDSAIYRTKIHCYFLDQSRVVKTPMNERNYHIFYQMLFGLTLNEKAKLYLDGYVISDFEYLNYSANSSDLSGADHQHHHHHQDTVNRFEAWKSCLSVLGIPFMDVARILAAILLLGNIKFQQQRDDDDNANSDFLIQQEHQNSFQKELHAVASLLGVSGANLYRGFAIRTHCTAKGQILKSRRTSESFKVTRDSLAKALYIRTVATIIRRANSSKRLASTCGTSSESNDSMQNNHLETSSHHAPSSIGSACGKSYKTMAVLNNAVRYSSMDGFIGILDMFGFEDGKPSRLEQLCINLCAETMQHFYNTHIFKSSLESCRDEGIKSDIEIDYVDNVPCIDLISSLRTGLFSLIDQECFQNDGTPESLVRKIYSLHHSNSRYLDVTKQGVLYQNLAAVGNSLDQCFGIKHFCGNVIYDASNFLVSNGDRLCDDVISVFHKSQCSFGFVTHLFGAELRALKNRGVSPLGIKFRISQQHGNNESSANGNMEPVSTFTQDFHNRLDNLLRTLVHARPHFIRCLKINNQEQYNYFDKFCIQKQIRALQILETVNLMAEGLPHRMRFKAFISRYRLLVRSSSIKQTEDTMIDDCKLILKTFDQIRATNHATAALTSWTLGRKHVFLSESARQQLEIARNGRRNAAATIIQATWRGYHLRCQWQLVKLMGYQTNQQQKSSDNFFRNKLRPRPILSTPPPFIYGTTTTKPVTDFCDLIKETCFLLGIDPNIPPMLPANRSYTVAGSAKCYFPQVRTLKLDYIDPMNNRKILKGQKLLVLGFSDYKRSCFTVEYHCGIPDFTLEMPQQFFEPIIYSNGGGGPLGFGI